MATQTIIPKILPSLVFDNQAEEAVNFYVSVFKNSGIINIIRSAEGQFVPKGQVSLIAFYLDGQEFRVANGGPTFKFSEGLSIYMNCETQEEIDEVWEKLLEGGQPQECGWLKDKFGVYWQIAPSILWEMMKDPDTKKTQRVLNAIYQMQKLDIAEIQRAYNGESPEP
ncbi:VOC family protein [Dyadobacter arcticus]|uniref:3-demethylubiquinone-9 3-methyltransferase (Glyoxalase superfamily) n=1 Tax=Dyadobacter arcticus TaxID=1078754 RepID=A0ABX0UNH6_9BACT|nr:VOC family protein [Dyadobacter arcticus]NIJ54548.1 putative 3-demethylubiquinone-9 3-methyltransferase (glyoxalase superfamily) [Dyadobacter arcticus]